MDFKTYFDDGEVRRRMKVFDSWDLDIIMEYTGTQEFVYMMKNLDGLKIKI